MSQKYKVLGVVKKSSEITFPVHIVSDLDEKRDTHRYSETDKRALTSFILTFLDTASCQISDLDIGEAYLAGLDYFRVSSLLGLLHLCAQLN